MTTKKPKKRFSNEQQIIDAIDDCHARQERLLKEAEQLEADAHINTRHAEEIHRLCATGTLGAPHTTEVISIAEASKAIHMEEEALVACLKMLGVNDKKRPIAKLGLETRSWIKAQWQRIAKTHESCLRDAIRIDLKRARRNRISARNVIEIKAAELGKLLAIMRTQAMPFLPATNRAQDISIPAELP